MRYPIQFTSANHVGPIIADADLISAIDQRAESTLVFFKNSNILLQVKETAKEVDILMRRACSPELLKVDT